MHSLRAQRFLKLLLGNIHPEDLLVITGRFVFGKEPNSTPFGAPCSFLALFVMAAPTAFVFVVAVGGLRAL
jgi:hypothetical protein